MKFLNRFKKILVVEDDIALQRALVEKCKRKGYAVIALGSGQEVLETVANEKPAGILLDLMLPGVDGLELLKQLRGNELEYDKPVVILTNLRGHATLRSDAERLHAKYFDKAETPIEKAVDALLSQL